VPGDGELVRRQHNYLIRLRLWLKQGVAVRWKTAWGPVGTARLEDDGETLITEVRIDGRSLVNGLFYGVEGMRIGGTCRANPRPVNQRGLPGIARALLRSQILCHEKT
jgi:hypothetical protein